MTVDTYRNDSAYPFCPGCGHGSILDALNEALLMQQINPAKLVIVSDIGCSGLSDQYFGTSAFHGLHGRSLTYATGIKLARPDLHVVVIMGDGGTGIGGAHLLNAARRNIGLTLLVFNNMNYGMTGGQHSTTTPFGSITSTTPGGNLEHPLDICATVGVNGAAYVYRGTNFDKDLPERIVEGMQTPGFAVLDIWDLCTAYFVPNNTFGKRSLIAAQEELGLPAGVLYQREADEYAAAYRSAAERLRNDRPRKTRALVPELTSSLDRTVNLMVAGSAGGKVRSAAKMIAEAAIRSNLYAAQRDDYPITVKTGHSVSQVVLSPHPIDFPGMDEPDVLVILSSEGLRKAARYLGGMKGSVFVVPEFAGVETGGTVTVLDPKSGPGRVAKSELALAVLAGAVVHERLLEVEALRKAVGAYPAFAEKNLAAIEAGLAMAGVS
jgi:pyruvate/2-oxoacid:ferredoxin oxidoreductase beta subunit/Pyruvate/2-oxoacid:ferredoxin oxidoreductase gamma subunit